MKITIKEIALVSCLTAAGFSVGSQIYADQVINDDLIVKRDLCVGAVTCVDGEVFDSADIKIKSNAPEIYFDDSSATTNDWSLETGIGSFQIHDRGLNSSIDTVPFEIAAGAPEDSLFVSSNGFLGLGEIAPQSRLHVLDSSSIPTRIDTTSGTNRLLLTHDHAGSNESTNGFWSSAAGFWIQSDNDYPFWIQPDTVNSRGNQVNLLNDNQVSVGTSFAAADHTLTVNLDGANTKAAQFNGRVTLAGNDAKKLNMTNGTDNWLFSVDTAGNLSISRQGSGLTELTLTKSGNIVTYGKVVSYGDVVYNGDAKFNGNIVINGTCTGC